MNEDVKKTEQGSDDRLQAALDRELGRLLEGRAGLEACCAANPELAAELRPLLQLALAGREALRTEIPSAARELTREKLLAQARSLSNQQRSSSGRLALLRPLALAAGLFLLLFAGTAVAASGAGPDSRLYPLKQQLESVRTTLAIQSLDQARVENGHANARLDEIQQVLDENRREFIPDLLARYDLNISNAGAYARSAAADGENTSEIDAQIQATRQRHEEMLGKISAEPEAVESAPTPAAPGETGVGNDAAQPSAAEPAENNSGMGAPTEDTGRTGGGSDGGSGSGMLDSGSHESGGQQAPEMKDGGVHNQERMHNESLSRIVQPGMNDYHSETDSGTGRAIGMYSAG